MSQTVVDVLIVGAGPAGLAAAIELGTRGHRVVVAERNLRGGLAPRAKTTNVRTRTHLRRWGIADRLAEESPFGVDYPNDMIFVTRLAGSKLAHFRDASNAAPARSPLYPEHGQWIPQYTLEKVLLEKVRTLPNVEVRFGTRLITAEQTVDEVLATLRDTDDGETTLRAAYMIGADGTRSPTRDLIGAKMEGQTGLLHSYNIIFRARGLATAHGHDPAVVYWQLGKSGFSAVGPMDRDDKWFFAPGGVAEGHKLSDAEAAALIVDRTGIDLPFEILSADNWTASALLADRYRDRRIFLAGDACHIHPPFGGFGMNMGIADGVDLGWKIAGVLQGWGGEALLDSYEAERRLVHRAVIDEAVANQAIVVAKTPPAIEDDTPEGESVRAKVGAGIQASKGREFHTLGTVLGLGYEGSPIVVGEGGTPPLHNGEIYTPTARPGYLAPHAWLPDGRSLYDILGASFSLIVAEGAAEHEIALAEAEARELGVPLTVVRPAGVPIADLYEAPLVLVRPDQHVAWRGIHWHGALRTATGNS